MRGQQKSKRVTWASDVNLCQVKLFLSEESPSQVGLGAQDHLQAKISWPSHSSGIVSDDNLPPGFEGTQPANLWKNKSAQIPVATWSRPPTFVLDVKWRVVAGEESNEVVVQKQREMRVLEAIYPRPSAIPPDPCMVLGEETLHNEQGIPLIPITPIEDEEAADASFDSVPATNAVISNPQVTQSGVPLPNSGVRNNLPAHGTFVPEGVPGMAPDVAAAAQAALAALTADNGQGNLIDRELLLKILSDPTIVEQLVTHQGVGTSSHSISGTSTQSVSAAGNMPNPRLQAPSFHNPPQAAISRADPSSIHHAGRTDHHVHVSRPELVMPSVAGASNGPFHSAPSRIGPIPSLRPRVPEVVSAPLSSVGAPVTIMSAPSSSMAAPAPKDINYYKSLIQQHGGERQETLPQYGNNRNNHHLGSMQEPQSSSSLRDSKPKIMKPCIYFNSSRGCRHGVNCAYMHDSSSQQRVGSLPEAQNSKRMKMDREITGT